MTINNQQSTINNLAFTLIELLVVISIIGILATLVTANLNAARSRARDAERKSDIRNMQTALRLYYNDNGGYPTNDGSGNINGCGINGVSTCTPGSPWASGSGATGTTYMSVLPKDPLPGQSYKYTSADTSNYVLAACLENASDASGKVDQTGWCPTSIVFQVSP